MGARATGGAAASQPVEVKAGDGRKDVPLSRAAAGGVPGLVVCKTTRQPVAGGRVIGLPDGNAMQQRVGRRMLEASAAPGGLQGGMLGRFSAGMTDARATDTGRWEDDDQRDA